MNQNTQCNYLLEWKPGQEICLVLSDESATDEEKKDHRVRTPEEINELFDVLKCAARTVGFDLSAWGLRESFEKQVNKKLIRLKIREAIKARDLQLAQMHPDACGFLKQSAPPLPEVSHLEEAE